MKLLPRILFEKHVYILALEMASVCISVPLWQIRIFGLLFHAKSGFFVQVRKPYILFSNCDTVDVGLLMKIKMQ